MTDFKSWIYRPVLFGFTLVMLSAVLMIYIIGSFLSWIF